MVDMLIIPIRSFHNVYIYVLKYHIILDPINTHNSYVSIKILGSLLLQSQLFWRLKEGA
jgi:hypothetical protein